MKNIILICSLILAFTACKTDDKRKVVDTVDAIPELKKEEHSVDIADLPIYIDSTNYVIHPIGTYSIENSRSSKYGGDSFYSQNYSVAKYNGYRIAGDLSNVKFQNIHSDVLKPLTNNIIKIHQMSFLFESFKTLKKGYYVYDVIDKDTNANGKLDKQDLKSIYISYNDGSHFKRLSPEHQDLIEWKPLPINSRLYFKTIEDTDNNGEFDKKDKMHYFYYDLKATDAKVTEYFPI
ncbi:hypothetical protein [Psychroserpens algicola]|uniref:hypothetical protein n=1 Tax=Psychroserpens algicola TaxID=1719034 RepID=UPI0019535F4E|nr:hypothetical protein [Psychroserpens algicola]